MPRLTRLDRRTLDPHARCGVRGCGGRLLVEDFRRHDAWRYELYCTRCQRCDPDGYGRQDAVMREGLAYFHAVPDQEEDSP